MVFLGTAEEISSIRPYWTEATRGLADVVQPQTCMLEIFPSGVSKDSGVKMLLDHLGIATDEVCNSCMHGTHSNCLMVVIKIEHETCRVPVHQFVP